MTRAENDEGSYADDFRALIYGGKRPVYKIFFGKPGSFRRKATVAVTIAATLFAIAVESGGTHPSPVIPPKPAVSPSTQR